VGGNKGSLRVLKLWTAVLALLCALVVAAEGQAGEIRRETFASKALKRDFPALVYVPSGYDASGPKRYPVLYLLHGAGADETTWMKDGGIRKIADDLIASGAIPPALIVMPGCPACWWVDGPRDKAETAFWSDLVPEVDRRFRTIDARHGRMIAGLSAGGFGAVRYGLKYPNRVVAVAALSPAIYAETPPKLSSARIQSPFLKPDGRFDDVSWAAHNYPALLPGYFAQPLRVAAYLATGDGDKLGIAYETALFHKRLLEHQADLTELRIVDGEHNWTFWASAMGEAMRYLFRFADPARSVAAVPAGDGAGLR